MKPNILTLVSTSALPTDRDFLQSKAGLTQVRAGLVSVKPNGHQTMSSALVRVDQVLMLLGLVMESACCAMVEAETT